MKISKQMALAVLAVMSGSTATYLGTGDISSTLSITFLAISVAYGMHVKALTKKTEELEHTLKHDPLTGLLNRQSFNEVLATLVSQVDSSDRPAASLAVMVMDLDKFKIINDTYGHTVGDELIVQASQRLSGVLRSQDHIGRLGGDEFAFILTRFESEETLLTIATRLLKCFEQPFNLSVNTVDLSASIGISLHTKHGKTATELLKYADVAMYVAKNEKLGMYFYRKDKDISSVDSLAIRTALRQAIDKGGLYLKYQPKKSLTTGRFLGMEALCRWDDVTLGEIPPDKFIPIAEQSGLIKSLTNWVLSQAMADFLKLREQGLMDTIAINISPYSLVQGDLIMHIARELATYSIPPSSLILEVTETSLNKGSEEYIKILLCLNMLGLSLSIDDFGIGQSSLIYLRSLPVKEIKVDKSFVSSMLDNKHDYNIISSIITLAHSVGCTVCAEGVENKETEDVLRGLGCDYIQGYYISKPLVFDELVKLLGEHNERVV